jgi:hypothetical protein
LVGIELLIQECHRFVQLQPTYIEAQDRDSRVDAILVSPLENQHCQGNDQDVDGHNVGYKNDQLSYPKNGSSQGHES